MTGWAMVGEIPATVEEAVVEVDMEVMGMEETAGVEEEVGEAVMVEEVDRRSTNRMCAL